MRPSVLIVASLLSLSACASESTGPESAPVATTPSSSVTTDIVYGHKDGLALTFDVYHPEASNGAGVISIESAGWRSSWGTMKQFVPTPEGLRPMSFEEIREVGGYLPAHSYAGLLEAGFTVFSVRHGSSPRYPMPEIVADMRRAVRYIRFHTDEYDVGTERLGVWGGSAGGHLSLLLATASEPGVDDPQEDFEIESTRVAAAVAYFPPTDLERWGTSTIRGQFPAVALEPAEALEYSPIHFVSPDDAPSLILHGDEDALVPIEEGETMFQTLSEAGVTTDFITIEGSDHGFYDDDAVRANAAMVDWFEQHLN